ncbi:hypothetical protein LCGC14_1435390 [marine sediment metagenome]|uniref:Uncharacterized protein n=1 Tax=marine sediment metagenome TaxID=412755 RepID=A0A0F9JMV7_9ZZZZ
MGTLTKVADVLADVTGRAGDVAPEEGSEAQDAISAILTCLAVKLGDEDGPSFLRMYARACEREDTNPSGSWLQLKFSSRWPIRETHNGRTK